MSAIGIAVGLGNEYDTHLSLTAPNRPALTHRTAPIEAQFKNHRKAERGGEAEASAACRQILYDGRDRRGKAVGDDAHISLDPGARYSSEILHALLR